jgi:hypothetical protein
MDECPEYLHSSSDVVNIPRKCTKGKLFNQQYIFDPMMEATIFL